MINLLVSVAAFAGVKLAFLWLFDSERKRSTQVPQVYGGAADLMESSDGPVRVSSLLSGNRLPRSVGLT
jgi:hypothetical protein